MGGGRQASRRAVGALPVLSLVKSRVAGSAWVSERVALTQAPESNTHAAGMPLSSHGSWSAESGAGPVRARERNRAEPLRSEQQVPQRGAVARRGATFLPVPLPGGQSGRAGGRRLRGRLGEPGDEEEVLPSVP